jgi:hypothetical protein
MPKSSWPDPVLNSSDVLTSQIDLMTAIVTDEIRIPSSRSG